MSKYSKFITWSKANSQHKKAVFSETVDKDGSWAEMNSDMENGCIDSKGVASAALAIAYADHCTAPLLARIAELEAALTEARSWIGDGEDSICSFVYPKGCSNEYVEMVNRVDSALSKGGAV